CGVGITYSGNDADGEKLRLGPNDYTRERAALTGVLHVLQVWDRSTPLFIGVEDKAVSLNLTKRLDSNVRFGRVNTGSCAQVYRATAAALLARSGGVTFVPFAKQGGRLKAIELAQAAHSAPPSQPSLTTNALLALRGRPLAGLTQGEAHKTVIATQVIAARKTTIARLAESIAAVGDATSRWPTPGDVWASLRSKDLHRPTREFLWRLAHGTQKVGPFWRNVKNLEHRATCLHCNGQTETMEHALLLCNAPGREIIWQETQQLWARSGLPWPDISLGAIISCGLNHFTRRNGKRDAGAARRFKILVSEAAFLVWRIRNEWVIVNEGDHAKYPTVGEIRKRWKATISRRIRLDTQLLNRRRFGTRAVNLGLFRGTWEPLRHPGSDPPPGNWWASAGFLDGMWQRRPGERVPTGQPNHESVTFSQESA
ncbi:hypothetical protein BKA62DRAFT_786372, partial [Auriculariales sp. MPI-PUGE-AT-0066]